MQLLGTDPINPDAKALQKNMNPQALLKFTATKIAAVRGQLSTITGSPNVSQIAFFVKWIGSFVNDCIWSLEMIDTVIGPANYRGAFITNASENDANMDVLYEDLSKATSIPAVTQAATSAFSQWNAAKGNRPSGSALVTSNEANIMAGTISDTFAASRDIARKTIFTKQEIEARSAVIRKIAPGVKAEATTIQYATGGAKSQGIINPMETAVDVPTPQAKPISPVVLIGAAIAGYVAYKSLS